jgi:hypothetical protein
MWNNTSALASVCRGFKGDSSALQYWLAKGAPTNFAALRSLCAAAASLGYIAALEFAETLPSFNGWKDDIIAKSILRAAIPRKQAALLRWVSSRPTFGGLSDHHTKRDLARLAALSGHLDVLKACVEGWGFTFDGGICIELVKKGPSHQHILDFIARSGLLKDVLFDDVWVWLAGSFKEEMEGGLQTLLDAGVKLGPKFGETAAASGVIRALDFAWDTNGSRDIKIWAEKAFAHGQTTTLEWLKKKDSKGLAALPLEGLKKLATGAKEANQWARWHGPWKQNSSTQEKEPSQVGSKRARSKDAKGGKQPPAKRARKDVKPAKQKKGEKEKQPGKGTGAKALKPIVKAVAKPKAKSKLTKK